MQCEITDKLLCTALLRHVTNFVSYIVRFKGIRPTVINIRSESPIHINLQYLIFTQSGNSVVKRSREERKWDTVSGGIKKFWAVGVTLEINKSGMPRGNIILVGANLYSYLPYQKQYMSNYFHNNTIYPMDAP